MTISNHEHHEHELNSVLESESKISSHHEENNSKDSTVISFRVTRQGLIITALVFVGVISALETFELWRLHQALQTWQNLPVVSAAPVESPANSTANNSNALPQQVGGC